MGNSEARFWTDSESSRGQHKCMRSRGDLGCEKATVSSGQRKRSVEVASRAHCCHRTKSFVPHIRNVLHRGVWEDDDILTPVAQSSNANAMMPLYSLWLNDQRHFGNCLKSINKNGW